MLDKMSIFGGTDLKGTTDTNNIVADIKDKLLDDIDSDLATAIRNYRKYGCMNYVSQDKKEILDLGVSKDNIILYPEYNMEEVNNIIKDITVDSKHILLNVYFRYPYLAEYYYRMDIMDYYYDTYCEYNFPENVDKYLAKKGYVAEDYNGTSMKEYLKYRVDKYPMDEEAIKKYGEGLAKIDEVITPLIWETPEYNRGSLDIYLVRLVTTLTTRFDDIHLFYYGGSTMSFITDRDENGGIPEDKLDLIESYLYDVNIANARRKVILSDCPYIEKDPFTRKRYPKSELKLKDISEEQIEAMGNWLSKFID